MDTPGSAILREREVQRSERKKRRKYTKEFKREAVQLVRDSDLSMAEVARDLGIPASCLGS